MTTPQLPSDWERTEGLPTRDERPEGGEPLPRRETPEGEFPTGDLPRRSQTPVPTTPPPTDDGGLGENEDAYQFLVAMLTSWGLDTLAPTVLQMLQDGYSVDTIPVLLQSTEAYKTRFAGNEERKRRGMAVLSPAEYLATESSYRQIMQAAGLPGGFYDNNTDFAGFIGRDVSPTELQRRVDSAITASNNIDPRWSETFRDYYGVSQNDLAAYFLDPDRGMDVLNRALRGTTIANAARARGIDIGRTLADQYGGAANADTYMQQAQRFADYASTGAKLGGIYGQNYTTESAGRQVFSNDLAAQDILKRLAGMEEAEFEGSSGVGSSSLSQRNQY